MSGRYPLGTLIITLVIYLGFIGPFTSYMSRKPIEEKLGYVPNANLLLYLSADQKAFIGSALMMKVIMYFGGLMDRPPEKAVAAPPDFRGMSNIIHTALKLDPYNMDGYYFAQSFLTWEVKQFDVANRLLDYGMKYRTWDWYLPFFAGFNHSYFMKDYKKASEYYLRAAELTGDDLFVRLAGRYMHESGQTDLAIAYLKAMIASSRNETAKKTFEIRLRAFEGVREIELSRDRFREKNLRQPLTVDELVSSGFLKTLPRDPYGGRFYLEPTGKVTTTSRFTFPMASQGETK